MTMISRKNIFFLCILVWALISEKQVNAQTDDVRMRLSTEIQKEINKKLSASLEYEHRFDQNLTTFDKAFLEPSISYDIIKPVRIGAIYRVMLDQNKTRQQRFEQRIGAYIRYTFKVDDFDIKVKTALQYGFDDLSNPSFSYDQKLINRNAIEVEYNWFGSKFTPFASYELFYHINHPNGGILNQWRLKTGSSYRISKSSRVQFYYLFENEFNTAYPTDAHVFGAGYSYRF